MKPGAGSRWAWIIVAGTAIGVAVTVLVGVSAIRTRRQVHRAAVASLTNYLAVALDRYATGVDALFRQGVYPAIPSSAAGGDASPGEIRRRLDQLRSDPCGCLPVPDPSTVFALGPDPRDDRATDPSGRSIPLDAAIGAVVRARREGLTALGSRYGIVAATTATGEQLVFFGGDPGAGITVPARQIGERIFRVAFANTRLVPRHLLDQIGGNSEFVSITVTTTPGTTIFESSAPYQGQSEGLVLPPLRGGLTFRANLNPRLKDLLVPGGVPPLVPVRELALLTLALALWVAIAIAALRAAELTRLRSDFVSSVTHELRTPLTQIRLAAETIALGRSRDRASEQRSLASVIEETTRLEQLIDNVLHWSRAERRLTTVTPREVALLDEVRKVVDGFAPLVTEAGVRFAIAIPDDLRVTVDPGALRQVLLNLLDNAVRYGPEGQTITVGARTVAGSVEVTVDDQGPGIPVALRDRAWRPFVRLDRSDPASTGTGLGLAVARELVEAHRGRCRIEASEDGGARVVVSLPIGAVG